MAGTSKPSAKWDNAEITTMIDMLQDGSDGNTCDNGWKGLLWQPIADNSDDRLKTRSACESKFVLLKKDYKEVRHLREISGFG